MTLIPSSAIRPTMDNWPERPRRIVVTLTFSEIRLYGAGNFQIARRLPRDELNKAARALSNTNERFQVDGQDDGRSTEVVNGACVSVYRNRCRGNPFCPSHFGINALDDLDPIFGDPPDDG